MSTWSAKPKDPARELPRFGETPNRPKISKLAAKVLWPTQVKDAKGRLILSTCSAIPKALAKALSKLGGTQLRRKTLERAVKALYQTKEKGGGGHQMMKMTRNHQIKKHLLVNKL